MVTESEYSTTSSDDDVTISKITTTSTKSELARSPHITVEKSVPPDYYVQTYYQSVKPGLHKTKQETNVKMITDEPKRDGLPQHVQKILPASSVYKCLEYEGI
jgi:hypothetical protein